MRRSGIGRSLIRARRVGRAAFAVAIFLTLVTPARAQQYRLFSASLRGRRDKWPSEAPGSGEFRIFDSDPSSSWSAAEPGQSDELYDSVDLEEAGTAASPTRRCVLIQCVLIPAEPGPPPPKLFTKPVTLWTATALFLGFAVGIKGPLDDGFQGMHFTDEGFFQNWTYGGGADKASHFVISADIAGLLSDAYTLNRLTPNQAFALSFAASLMAGFFVEMGDGLTPYGFSPQDLAADALGAFFGALIKREHLDDVIGFRLGLTPTTIPPELTAGHVFFGIDYSREVFTADLKIPGLADHLHFQPGISRFLLLSFVFMTKGYGYEAPLPERYQEIGFEVGLNIPEILRAVGVRNTTWWGDLLLRAFDFVQIPFTQIGVYYNLANQKWYGPSAPYQFY